MKPLSQLLNEIPPSATLVVNDKAKMLRAAGHDLVVLAGGDPDFATPEPIVEAAFAAIRAGDTHYPAPAFGTKPAVKAILEKFGRDTGLSAEPNQVIITPGGKWAIYLALTAIINPLDEVLYLEPVWTSYPWMIRLAGGVPVPVALSAENNFAISADFLRQHLTPRTKAIMVNSPNNPTGRVATRAEIEAIVQIALEHDLYVISDELYEQLIYDGHKHYPLSAENGMAERTITINGVSKAYAMTGWRLGWLIAPPAIAKLAGKMHSQTISSASSFGMAAMTEALQGDQSYVAEMRESYRARRDFMVDALNQIAGMACPNIEGAFYLFPRFAGPFNSITIAEKLLDAGVAGTPGIAFGTSGEHHIRFSIATAMSELEKAAERLAKFVPQMG